MSSHMQTETKMVRNEQKKKNGGVKVCEKESQASIRERPRTIDEKKN